LRSHELWRETPSEKPDRPYVGKGKPGALREKPAVIGGFQGRPEPERLLALGVMAGQRQPWENPHLPRCDGLCSDPQIGTRSLGKCLSEVHAPRRRFLRQGTGYRRSPGPAPYAGACPCRLARNQSAPNNSPAPCRTRYQPPLSVLRAPRPRRHASMGEAPCELTPQVR
jgi:hypothetical protein